MFTNSGVFIKTGVHGLIEEINIYLFLSVSSSPQFNYCASSLNVQYITSYLISSYLSVFPDCCPLSLPLCPIYYLPLSQPATKHTVNTCYHSTTELNLLVYMYSIVYLCLFENKKKIIIQSSTHYCVTLQCKSVGLGYFCWSWETWGIWVRRPRLTSPFFPSLSFYPSTLPILCCPSGPSRGLPPRQPTDYIAMSTHRHQRSYYVLKASMHRTERGILASQLHVAPSHYWQWY